VCPAALVAAPRNIVNFVADGLRHGSLTAQDVSFLDSHALFPTFTTPNAAAIATGHYPGDTGDFANALYTGYQLFNGANFAHSHTESAARLHHIQYIRRS
jgi:predicted AlkP superfamily pyrophosphatase or phosphodiesterase